MKRIRTLKQLQTAVTDRRSVVMKGYYPYRLPAAVVMNWIGSALAACFARGMYVYEPKHPRRLRDPGRVVKHRTPKPPPPPLLLGFNGAAFKQ